MGRARAAAAGRATRPLTSATSVRRRVEVATEDLDGGFARGCWWFPYFDADADVMGPIVGDSMEGLEALLFGRRTWRVMADAWPECVTAATGALAATYRPAS